MKNLIRRWLGLYDFGQFVDDLVDGEAMRVDEIRDALCELIAALQRENSDIKREQADLRKQLLHLSERIKVLEEGEKP